MSETSRENQSQALGQEALTKMRKWYSFKGRKDSANYLWNLYTPNIESELPMDSDIFKSATHRHEWSLHFSLHDENENVGVFWLILKSKLPYRKNMYIKYKVDVVNREYEILKSGKSSMCSVNKNYFMKEVLNIPLVELKPDDSLVDDESLNMYVYCELKIYEEDSTVKTSNELNVSIEEPHRICQDLGVLLKNQLFCDITLSVKETQFRAHKVILAARSSVFEAMFNHPMKENLTNTIEIADIDVKTVQEMLDFIYTGKCDHLDQLADKLFIAADKYDLKGLKVECEQVLGRNLTIGNAADTLLFADLHHANWLKSCVIEFIVAEFTEVIKTVSWRSIALANPHLTIEVCDALVRLGHV